MQQANNIVQSFSASGRALFLFFSGLLILSTVALVYLLNAQFLIAAPARGGALSEGIIGAPRFINPVLALSDADHDLSALVYSGLLKAAPEGGYVPDLAQSYAVSDEGRVYTFTLKPDATFHDGTPVTASDVVFTIAKTQDPQLKSPERANWNSVTVEEIDAHTVRFTLKQAYAPFVENVTLGILPKHLWQSTTAEDMTFSNLNSNPIGSGPFMVSTVSRNSSGIPTTYTLTAFAAYALGEPYLTHLTFNFYKNESDLLEALQSGAIETASGISPAALADLDTTVDRSPLNRVFAVFFNQNQSEVLRDKAVRQALNSAINRHELVSEVLGGYGTPIDGPIPPVILGTPAADTMSDTASAVAAAQQMLVDAGWETGPDGIFQKTTGTGSEARTLSLSFSLATGNVPELRAAAEYVRKTWAEMGARVEVQVYDQGDLSQNIIRPRKYDALLFGEVVGREMDLFAFWDSSQRVDPGLNVALYANATADKLLAQLRQTADPATRTSLYEQFAAELRRDIPAVFLYAPDFVYIIPKDLQGLDLKFIETPSDRFLSAHQWHRETDFVWPFFAAKK